MLTQEQKEKRKTGIGGSDAAAIAGLSRWRTPVQIYLEKIGYAQTDDLDYREYIYWGNILEPIIADEYAKRAGVKLQVSEELKRHPQYTFMIANVDRVIEGDNALLECKTCSQYKAHEWGEEGSDDIPSEYLLQCAHYAIVCDAKYVDIAVLFGGQRLGLYCYRRNKKLEANLIEMEHDFWFNHVQKMEPPKALTTDDCYQLYPLDNGETVDATEEISAYLQDYRASKEMIKNIQSQADFYKTKIAEYMKSATALKIGNVIAATWKRQQANRLNIQELKTANMNIYNQFLSTSESRVFRVK